MLAFNDASGGASVTLPLIAAMLPVSGLAAACATPHADAAVLWQGVCPGDAHEVADDHAQHRTRGHLQVRPPNVQT